MIVLGLIAIYLVGVAYVFYTLNWGDGKKVVLEVELNRKKFLTTPQRIFCTSLIALGWPVLVFVGAYLIVKHLMRKG